MLLSMMFDVLLEIVVRLLPSELPNDSAEVDRVSNRLRLELEKANPELDRVGATAKCDENDNVLVDCVFVVPAICTPDAKWRLLTACEYVVLTFPVVDTRLMLLAVRSALLFAVDASPKKEVEFDNAEMSILSAVIESIAHEPSSRNEMYSHPFEGTR